ncbi:phenylalanine--tRNA ligase subunit beta [Alterisphingorhabdus coralli]|uniref:Phenylalanine--tRNA ligase beta subunit n=1 Tax=Alterisphingorhabdus coralli TaxID=3071408 RepID=A0AA97I1L4_9SPHN|nr:phenylalanine--tRNA ligase subunit beta [Parasphingorhabdus sp. SCSIO 66989]WOE75420.1 phenylalanine--tRNA ligase subunit beta [Parasphingorhabdus sp. SCSIO 66989]
MKFTLSWLKEHLDTEASLEEITDKLTAIGLELEGVENPADALRPFRVAKVLEAGPHPNADKLQLLKVDDGSDQPWQVVCGAPNARTGMVGVFGPPGTYIPGSDFTLKPAKIRDVESFGMMCSARELELGEDHDGIIELDVDAESAVGQSYADYAGLDDPVIDVSVTPNKQDCMGVRGIARDLAASGIGTLKPLNADAVERSGTGPDIRISDSEGCPAFYACIVSGVSNGAAPDWMQQRLRAIGQNPISALVDITNYVMFDLGRPLHVYDIAKLNGPLEARKARPGESLTALNGKEYTLDETMTVIADGNGAHDIGGIMGGEATGAADDTTDVLIECAYFTPERIAMTGQKLMLTSDARQRFERGVDPAFLDDGIEIATAYVVSLCGGKASEITRTGTPPTEQRSINYDPSHCLRLGGVDVALDEQQAILERLGFAITRHPREGGDQASSASTQEKSRAPDQVGGDEKWDILVPTWRRDVHGSADIVEEVIRITGLDAVPSTPLPRAPGVAKPTASPAQLMERKVRRAAAARGLNEAVNWSFISEKEDAALRGQGNPGGDNTVPWVLANPISEDLKVMRTSMLPGLLSAAKRNMDRGATSICLFEVGRRYFRSGTNASDERATIGLVLAGEATPRQWQTGKAVGFDPYAIKAEVLALLEAAGAPVGNLMDFVPDDAGPGGHYHPGQSATLRLGPKKLLAAYGTLHPKTAKAFGLKGAVMAAEIFLDAIPAKRSSDHMRSGYAPPALQDVTRDFAFVVDAALPAGDLVRSVKSADKKAIVGARIFDVFTGAELGDDKKSLALEVTLRPGTTSFTDEELKAISDKIIANATKLGAELRG